MATSELPHLPLVAEAVGKNLPASQTSKGKSLRKRPTTALLLVVSALRTQQTKKSPRTRGVLAGEIFPGNFHALRSSSIASPLLAEKRIKERFQDRPSYKTWHSRISLTLVGDHRCWRLRHRKQLSECLVLLDINVERAAAVSLALTGERGGLYRCARVGLASNHQSLDPLEIRGLQRSRHELLNISIDRPGSLIVKKRSVHLLEFSNLCGRIRPARGLMSIGMHGQRKISVNEVDFSRSDVVSDHILQGALVEIPARRALVITKYFHRDRRGAVSDRLPRRCDFIGISRRGGVCPRLGVSRSLYSACESHCDQHYNLTQNPPAGRRIISTIQSHLPEFCASRKHCIADLAQRSSPYYVLRRHLATGSAIGLQANREANPGSSNLE